MPYNDEPRVSVGLTRKMNFGNYESGECQMHLTQIPYNANETLIRQMLATAEMTFSLMKDELAARVFDIVGEYRSVDQLRLDTETQRHQAAQNALSPYEDEGLPTTRPKKAKKNASEAPVQEASSAAPSGKLDEYDPHADTDDVPLTGEALASKTFETFNGPVPAKRDAFGVELAGWPAKLETWTKPPDPAKVKLVAALLERHSVPAPDIKELSVVVLAALGVDECLHRSQGAAMVLAGWLDRADEAAFEQAYAAINAIRKLAQEQGDKFSTPPAGRAA